MLYFSKFSGVASGIAVLLLLGACSKNVKETPPAEATTPVAEAPAQPVMMPEVAPSSAPAEAAPNRHTVEKGDTLYSLAKKYGHTVKELKQWNKLKSNMLKIGQELVVNP